MICPRRFSSALFVVLSNNPERWRSQMLTCSLQSVRLLHQARYFRTEERLSL